MTSRDELYVILEVLRTASVDEIKKAFRKLARRYHPDINPGDRLAEERFKRITEAYEILSDPMKRKFYDVNGFYTEGVLEQQEGSPVGVLVSRVLIFLARANLILGRSSARSLNARLDDGSPSAARIWSTMSRSVSMTRSVA